MHNHGAMFDMLARVHEVDAEHVEIALIAAKILIHTDSNDIAAKRDHGMAQGRTLPKWIRWLPTCLEPCSTLE